jgi:hypothetical protein
MPPQHRLWLHNDQRGAPLPPSVGEEDPKEPISWAELWAVASTRQCGELLTKRQVLKGNRFVSAAHQADRSEEYDKRRQHAASCRVFGDRINRLGRPIALWRRTTQSHPICELVFARALRSAVGQVLAASRMPFADDTVIDPLQRGSQTAGVRATVGPKDDLSAPELTEPDTPSNAPRQDERFLSPLSRPA